MPVATGAGQDTIQQLIKDRIQHQQWDDALKQLRQLTDQNITKQDRNYILQNIILEGMFKKELYGRAEYAVKFSELPKQRKHYWYARCAIKSNNHRDARTIIETQTLSPEDKKELLQKLATLYIKNGDIHNALLIIHKIHKIHKSKVKGKEKDMLLRDAVEKLLDQEKITFARFLYDKIECAQIKREIKSKHPNIQQKQEKQQQIQQRKQLQRKYNNDISDISDISDITLSISTSPRPRPRTSGTSSDGWWSWFTRTKKRT